MSADVSSEVLDVVTAAVDKFLASESYDVSARNLLPAFYECDRAWALIAAPPPPPLA